MTPPEPKAHKRGEVVLVLFPHSDLRTAKTRPALIVQADNLETGLAQVIVAMISARTVRAGYPSRVLVSLSTPEGGQSGLLTDSVVMTDNLATIIDAAIDRVIGTLPMARVDVMYRQLKQSACRVLSEARPASGPHDYPARPDRELALPESLVSDYTHCEDFTRRQRSYPPEPRESSVVKGGEPPTKPFAPAGRGHGECPRFYSTYYATEPKARKGGARAFPCQLKHTAPCP